MASRIRNRRTAPMAFKISMPVIATMRRILFLPKGLAIATTNIKPTRKDKNQHK
jgi:hypothetical protein